jgi:glycosyltransferase involved in cell wall biosynthesis
MQDQRVSVVVTTFRRDDFLAEALTSLANQTLPLHEVVVVDDGGMGTARLVVEGFDSRFRYVWQRNSGMQAARNRGFQESTGSWVAFLDDDDLWEADRNALIADLIATDQVDLITGNFQKFGRAWQSEETVFDEFMRHAPGFWNGFPRPAGQRFSIIGRFPPTRLFPSSPFWPSTLVIQRDLFVQLGGWDVSLWGMKAEDIDFAFRAIKLGRLGVIWVPTVRYRCHDGNDSIDELAVALGRVQIWEKLLKRPDLDEAERDTIGAAIAQGLSAVHWSAFAKRDYKTVTHIAARMGWHKQSFAEIGKSLVANLLNRFSKQEEHS